MQSKYTAIANVNFALSKYWGKRDQALMLPSVSSVSITLDDLFTKTSVEVDETLSADEVTINGEVLDAGSSEYLEYTGKFLDIAREMAGTDSKIRMASENNFPTGAGLASSASGFAALAVAVNEAFSLKLDTRELSILARRGSGSATRSILGGFNAWSKGERDDGLDSCIEHIADADYWPDFRVLICITETKKKKVSSRVGMSQTVNNSRIFNQLWIKQAEEDAAHIKQAILDKDIEVLGSISEKNTQLMHASMLETTPPILYWNDTSYEIVQKLVAARERGLKSLFYNGCWSSSKDYVLTGFHI